MSCNEPIYRLIKTRNTFLINEQALLSSHEIKESAGEQAQADISQDLIIILHPAAAAACLFIAGITSGL